MKSNHLSSIFLGSLLFSSMAFGMDIRVNSTLDRVDSDPSDGICATQTGECTLRAAVQTANATPGADRIILPSGNYYLSVGSSVETDEDDSIYDLDLFEAVTIVGEDSSNRPVIDANNLHRVFHVVNPAGTFITFPGNVLFKDLVVQNGSDQHGGCLYNRAQEIELDNVHFEGCVASLNGGAVNSESGPMTVEQSSFVSNDAGYRSGGGAIYINRRLTINESRFEQNTAQYGSAVYTRASTKVTESTFVENISSVGGGLYLYGSNYSDVLFVQDSQFSRNETTANHYGSAVKADKATLIVRDSNFDENKSLCGGAGVAGGQALVYINDSQFTNNTGGVCVPSSSNDGKGAAVYLGSGQINVFNSEFTGNSIADGAGGALYIYSGKGHIEQSSFTNNTGDSAAGAVGVRIGAELTVAHSSFTQNSSDQGGALYASGKLTVKNSTIYDNSANYGGGVSVISGDVELSYSTIHGNEAVVSGANLHRQSGVLAVGSSIVSGPVGATNCEGTIGNNDFNLVTDTSCGLIGIVNSNPGLRPYSNGTLELESSSAAIDGGNLQTCEAHDQRGHLRSDGSCDIGAVEYGARYVSPSEVEFSQGSLRVAESAPDTSLAVERSSGANGDIRVFAYNTLEGDAAYSDIRLDDPHSFYMVWHGVELNWDDADTADFDLVVAPQIDSAVEQDETYELELLPLQGFVAPASTNKLLVTVQEPRLGKARLSKLDIPVTECNGCVEELVIERVGGSDGVLVVNYQIGSSQQDTATPGLDYLGVGSTRVQFNDGETQKTIQITIYEDNLIEDAQETFSVLLSAYSSDLIEVGQELAQVRIIDNDRETAKFDFAVSSYSQDEDRGAIDLTVTRADALTESASVTVTTINGTAEAGSDYAALVDRLVFGPNETSKTISVNVTADTVVEGDETFTVRLDNPSSNANVVTASIPVTILNDDTAIEQPGTGTCEDGAEESDECPQQPNPQTPNTPENPGVGGNVEGGSENTEKSGGGGGSVSWILLAAVALGLMRQRTKLV